MEFCGFKSDVLFCGDFKFEILDYTKYGITSTGRPGISFRFAHNKD